jgi:hypothetical protein
LALRAALIHKVFGIIQRASLNSAIEIYSLVPRVLAKVSREVARAISQAPPPGTT